VGTEWTLVEEKQPCRINDMEVMEVALIYNSPSLCFVAFIITQTFRRGRRMLYADLDVDRLLDAW
jgi:hypothetical protein